MNSRLPNQLHQVDGPLLLRAFFISSFVLATTWLSAQQPGYCASRGLSTLHGFISKVSMEAINNSSGNNNGYGNFTNLSTKLQKGADYTIELTPGFVNQPGGGIFFEYWSVYIDYNHDGVFGAGELVAHGNAAIRINKSFPVPISALNGPTRMRIQMQPGSEQTNPCSVYSYGEVEDYTVDLVTSIGAEAQTTGPQATAFSTDTHEFGIFPNPSRGGKIVVQLPGPAAGSAQFSVYTLLGQKIVLGLFAPTADTTYSVDLKNLPPGIYIIEVSSDGIIEGKNC